MKIQESLRNRSSDKLLTGIIPIGREGLPG